MGILDFLFPKYCVNCKKLGSYLCANCFTYLSFDTYGICLVCSKPSIDSLTHSYCRTRYSIDGCFSAILYKGVARKLIFQFKYKPFVSDLARVLGDLFYESLIQKEGFARILEAQPIIVPIPLHSSKLKARGYNHAKILADELSGRFSLASFELLKRVKKTSSQFGLTRKERRENLGGAFSLLPSILVSKYPNILIVDDILTTGATLSEAAKTLKNKGAKRVWAVILAQD